MREEDPYGTYCSIASELNRAIYTLSYYCKVPDEHIRKEIHEIIEKCLTDKEN